MFINYKMSLTATNNLSLRDAADKTKIVTFDMTNQTTNTTRTHQFPTSSTQLIGTTDSATMTNKTCIDTGSNIAANSLKTATNTVNVSSSAAPTGAGFSLVTTSSTGATWQRSAAETIYTTPDATSTAPTIASSIIEYLGTSTTVGGFATFQVSSNSTATGTALFTNAIGGTNIWLLATASRNGTITVNDTPICAFYDVANSNRTVRISVRVGRNIIVLGGASLTPAPNGVRVWLYLKGT